MPDKGWEFWRKHKAADDLVPDPHTDKTVPGIITRLCLNHFTHRSYGEQLLNNLAPGIPNPLSLEPSLPSEVVDLLKWRNGFNGNSDTHTVLILNFRLLSYDESCSLAEDLENDDIYLIAATIPTCLYALLRRLEAGAERGQLSVRKSSGIPWKLIEDGGGFAFISESDIDEDEDEGEAEMVGTLLENLNVNG
ncbi:hypothetical protein BDD12DRAFT_893703 [Trichophaea hybrida]|nr:hypothetical protein BDD12DRAFT_893703 [Trichophaea hybrida]